MKPHTGRTLLVVALLLGVICAAWLIVEPRGTHTIITPLYPPTTPSPTSTGNEGKVGNEPTTTPSVSSTPKSQTLTQPTLKLLTTYVALTPNSAAFQQTCPTPLSGQQHENLGKSDKTVAITFDDGPGKGTPEVLQILAKEHVHATFFLIGRQIVKNPQMVKAIQQGGHLIGNHTLTHPHLPRDTTLQIHNELAQTTNLLTMLLNEPVCLIRAPRGEVDTRVLNEARDEKMSVWNWTTSAGDSYKIPNPNVLDQAEVDFIVNGSKSYLAHPTVLLHDSQPNGVNVNTLAALPLIIEWYKSQGYTFVDVNGNTGP
jgi:peptidoglycan/xylan/chitin deacetylase (PgdA/CDA1 family)